MLDWMYEALGTDNVSPRLRLAFVKWLANEQHTDMKLDFFYSLVNFNIEQQPR
jgi:hypothetical protein